MKRFVLLLFAALAVRAACGQAPRRFCFSTAVGAGIALSEPASTPLVWRVAGYCRVGRRFLAGAGTGLSFYEKTLVPLFADVRLLVTRPRRFTPYAGCAVGYAFAPGRTANGGFMLNPSVGVRYALLSGTELFLAAGYEMQKLERLKKYAGAHFAAEFGERLRHGTVLLQAGILF